MRKNVDTDHNEIISGATEKNITWVKCTKGFLEYFVKP